MLVESSWQVFAGRVLCGRDARAQVLCAQYGADVLDVICYTQDQHFSCVLIVVEIEEVDLAGVYGITIFVHVGLVVVPLVAWLCPPLSPW